MFDFKCPLKSLTRMAVHCTMFRIHWLHLHELSPLCIFRWFLKLFAQEDTKSHRFHLFCFSPLFAQHDDDVDDDDG